MVERERERNHYLEKLIETLFFNDWRQKEGFHQRIEFMITSTCNLGCKYCYVHKYGEELFPSESMDSEEIKENMLLLLRWLKENNLRPPKWDIFSGALLSQEIGFEVVDIIYEFLRKEENKDIKPNSITIPSNAAFVLNQNLLKRVEEYIRKFANINIRLHFSLSVEGKYMEQNRPFRQNLDLGEDLGQYLIVNEEGGDPRSEKYYHNLFKFSKRWGFGFHPMVYSNDIQLWKKNFIWFQDMFRKYNLNNDKIFLLEVRNPEWSEEQIYDFYEFIKFVYRWAFENIYKAERSAFISALKNRKERGIINLLYSPLGYSKEDGMPCSIQNTFFVRVGDLHISPCHRTCYNGYEYGKFKKDSGRITGVEAINPELATMIYSIDHKSNPYCSTCPIRKVCNMTCLGANFESEGDFFTPSPKNCQLQHAKVKGVVDGLSEIGVFYEATDFSNEGIRETFRFIKDLDEREVISSGRDEEKIR